MHKHHLLWVSLTWPALPFAALAQAPATAPVDQSLPAVTVTGPARRPASSPAALATGVATPRMDTPFSVGSVSAEQVREQAGTTLQDALRNVPGAQADAGFNGSHTQFFILRGAIADSGTGSNRVLRDGVRLSNYPYVPAFIDSVDVLRGPGAALGVRSEPGGTVNLTTRQPQLSNQGSVYLSAGSGQAHELSVDINRVLSPEHELAARLIATRSHASTWRHVPDELDGLRLALSQSDGERHHLSASFEASNQTYQPDYGLPSLNGRPVNVPRDRQLGEPFADSTTRNRIADLHADVALDDATRLSASYTHLEAQSTTVRNQLWGGQLPGQAVGTFARSTSLEPDTTRRIDSLSTAWTQRRNTGAWAHHLHAGIDAYQEVLDQPGIFLPPSASPGINVFNPVYGLVTVPANLAAMPRMLTTEDLHAVGGSLQDQIDHGSWTLAAGLRFDRQKFLYGGAGVQPVEESRWSPKLALLKRLSDQHTVYVNGSTGTSPNQVSSASNQSLPSRRSAQTELGWKAMWRGGQLVSDVAIYRLAQKNMISADQRTPANNYDFDLAGQARSQGLEASLTGAATDRVMLAATYAYTDATFRDNALYGNQTLPNIARHSASVWADYRWNDAWTTGGGVYAQGSRAADEAHTAVLPGYAKVDITQRWHLPLGPARSLELQLALRNVFDKSYQVASHLHVSRWITPGQGRNASLSAHYRF